ncbi:ice-binding family protein [Humidisolicoccus flavus]|uniref:ice-binding family protein n=1 Tax=Humidisolicoccus flavus TaxID=3111414 RepID=UPI00324F9D3A
MRSLNSTIQPPVSSRFPHRRSQLLGGILVLCTGAVIALSIQPAQAIASTIDLGVADSFSVLASASITNTGPSVLDQDIGLFPGTEVTGFPPGNVEGEEHITDEVAQQAQADLLVAFNNAAGQDSDAALSGGIGGETLTPGVYTASSSLLLTGNITLDAQGDEDAIFLFQVGSALTTATSSSITMTNGGNGCNVFWQVGSSATLGTTTAFQGTILAGASISTGSGTTINGRALALGGSVTLINTNFTTGNCVTEVGGPSETTPGETTPGETSPGETTPGETTPGETTPAETTPGETSPGETTPAETTPGETTPAETTPAETTPGEGVPEESAPGATPEESATTPTISTPGVTAPAPNNPGAENSGNSNSSLPATGAPGIIGSIIGIAVLLVCLGLVLSIARKRKI